MSFIGKPKNVNEIMTVHLFHLNFFFPLYLTLIMRCAIFFKCEVNILWTLKGSLKMDFHKISSKYIILNL